MFETRPIAQLVDELPQKNLTTHLLRTLDLVAPGEWGNPTGFESLIRQTSGENRTRRLRTLREVAERIYQDPSEGYQRALWTYRAVDLTDRAIAAAAVADKLGEKISLLRFLRRLTPKSDTVQAVDFGLKLAAEAVAYGFLHGVPRDGIVEFGRSLAGYGKGNLLRIGTLIAVDGLVPLGPDFLQRSVEVIGKPRSAQLRQSALYQQIRSALPGTSDTSRLGAVRETLESAGAWISEFATSRGLTRERVLGSLSTVIQLGDESLDYLAAFLDAATDYFTHTGTQTVATMLIEEAIAEAPRELAAEAPVLAALPKKDFKKQQQRQREALRRRHEREREDLKRRHELQRERLEKGFWDEEA